MLCCSSQQGHSDLNKYSHRCDSLPLALADIAVSRKYISKVLMKKRKTTFHFNFMQCVLKRLVKKTGVTIRM